MVRFIIYIARTAWFRYKYSVLVILIVVVTKCKRPKQCNKKFCCWFLFVCFCLVILLLVHSLKIIVEQRAWQKIHILNNIKQLVTQSLRLVGREHVKCYGVPAWCTFFTKAVISKVAIAFQNNTFTYKLSVQMHEQ